MPANGLPDSPATDTLLDQTVVTNVPGRAPYVSDDTRAWIDAYRVANKVKPALLIRAATDSNYVNNQFIPLPAYGGNNAFTQAICNVVGPGQRIPGCLTWNVSESLENLVNGATLQVLDALPKSRISATVVAYGVGTKNDTQISQSTTMPARWYSDIIRYQWVTDGDGIPFRLDGNHPIGSFQDPTLDSSYSNPNYREENLLYRLFEPEIIFVDDISQFPDPAVPPEEAEGTFNLKDDGINEWWDVDNYDYFLRGIGAYYILLGDEVMRVTQIDRNRHALYVIPGGRGAAGYITTHKQFDKVTLLGMAPFSGDWAGFGYLMPKDFKVMQSPMRPGACYVSYEGWGNPGDYAQHKVPLNKKFDRLSNMNFTGYWFATSPAITLDDTAVPKLEVTFQSAGYILTEQKVDPDTMFRARASQGGWADTVFDDVHQTRTIALSSTDKTAWDSTLPGSYPLQIFTEYAQHKAFFDHMNDTDFGRQCEFCQQEWIDYVVNHEHGKPTGSIAEARAVGKHIYQESIRVFFDGGHFNAGPLKTFGRLMFALAIAAWEHPIIGGLQLGTRWTKMPDNLFNNMNNWYNGRVWNGQLGFEWDGDTPTYDYSFQTVEDKLVYGVREPLKSPFTASYDRQPWSQPMQDLADLNRMTFTISREGYPIFIPTGHKLRGLPKAGIAFSQTPSGWFTNVDGSESGDGDVGKGEWHLSYGGSIDSYSHTIDASNAMTLCYVSCQTAFTSEITFTIAGAGTGIKLSVDAAGQPSNKIVWYSSIIGNKEGLQFTGGVQQADTVSLDNLILGLEWNTKPASWGTQVLRDGNVQTIDGAPPVPKPTSNGKKLVLFKGSKDAKDHPGIVTNIQRCLNFFMNRRYVGPAIYDKGGHKVFAQQLEENGVFGDGTDQGVRNVQHFLTSQGVNAGWTTGHWDDALVKGINGWIKHNIDVITTDIWWYVQNGRSWDEYVGAITGLVVPQRRNPDDNSAWIVDQYALKTTAQDWMKQFYKDAVNYANQVVDESVNKSTQKIVQTNFADPRIQLGDVIWARVPSYMDIKNTFGQARQPFTNGVYLTAITREMDLQQGSYTASYQGYRYGGGFGAQIMVNPNNYCSRIHNEV